MGDSEFKLDLLLDCLRVRCRYFLGDEQICGIADQYDVKDKDGEFIWHIALNCYGEISKCDLPEVFQRCITQ